MANCSRVNIISCFTIPSVGPRKSSSSDQQCHHRSTSHKHRSNCGRCTCSEIDNRGLVRGRASLFAGEFCNEAKLLYFRQHLQSVPLIESTWESDADR